jgi:hypothetical protein
MTQKSSRQLRGTDETFLQLMQLTAVRTVLKLYLAINQLAN